MRVFPQGGTKSCCPVGSQIHLSGFRELLIFYILCLYFLGFQGVSLGNFEASLIAIEDPSGTVNIHPLQANIHVNIIGQFHNLACANNSKYSNDVSFCTSSKAFAIKTNSLESSNNSFYYYEHRNDIF